MSSKRKFKRDYIILEAKDMNFRSKERVLPKAFAKIEINEDKSMISLYVENLKNLKDGYDVVVIRDDYERADLGKINMNSQGKGEFKLDLNEEDSNVKAVALIYDKYIPLIGFKGSKIDNYEALLIEEEEEIQEVDTEDYEEVVEYINPEDEYEYEEIEYIYEDDLIDEYEDDIEDISESNTTQETTPIQQEKSDEYIEEYEYQEIYEDALIENESVHEESVEYKNTEVEIKKENQNVNSNRKKIVRDEFNNIINSEDDKDIKTAGKLLMPRQIKKGLKYFKEVKPFAADYIENTRWWKIDINPTTMCGYTMPYLGYINSLNYTMYSDIAMNSYKYRHYLFGVQYDEYNKRKNYIYAIPGKKNEQPDKGTTGFTFYQPCDNRNNSLGYWICFIDSRVRKIIK